MHGTWNMEHGTRIMEHGSWNTDHGTRNMDMEHGTRNTQHGTTRNMEHGTRNMEQGTRNMKHGARNTEIGTWTWNTEHGHGTRNMEHGTWTWNTERGTWNAERATRNNTEHGAWNTQQGTRKMEHGHGTRIMEHGTWNILNSVVLFSCCYKGYESILCLTVLTATALSACILVRFVLPVTTGTCLTDSQKSYSPTFPEHWNWYEFPEHFHLKLSQITEHPSYSHFLLLTSKLNPWSLLACSVNCSEHRRLNQAK